MVALQFRPGFRLSLLDGLVLVVSIVSTVVVWPLSLELAALGAVVVGHFFPFFNVFRVSRPPELVWSLVFLACAGARFALGAPWSVAAGIVALATTAVIWRETRKPSYHGVFWRQLNPDLPEWWTRHRV